MVLHPLIRSIWLKATFQQDEQKGQWSSYQAEEIDWWEGEWKNS